MARILPLALLPAMFLYSGTALARHDAFRDALGELEKIARTYRLEIVTVDPSFPVKTTYGTINGTTGGQKELQDYISLFCPEFGLYPPTLVERSHLKRVVLCSELSFDDQRRNAVPDYEHDTLYLDVSRGTYSRTYLRKVIHHEFFHIIDYRDDGSVYSDDRWVALNPATFKYGSGGKAAQDSPQTSVLTDKFPGFLNHYSTTAVEEDKAELFANLIVDLKYVQNRASQDRELNAKLQRMKELLVEFCPEMNDRFWAKVAEAKRADK